MHKQKQQEPEECTHSMEDNTYMHTKQKPNTNTVSIKTLGNTVPDKLFHLSSEI